MTRLKAQHLLLALLLPLQTACASSPKAEPEAPSSETKSDEPQKSGAYSDEATDTEEIVSTAARALQLLKEQSGDESLELQSIERAESQVVAGKNTRLTLLLSSASGEKKVTVVVFRSLKGEESLSEVSGL